MRAVVWCGPGHVQIEEVPDPQLLESTDAIVRVTLASICGTDLHAYRGHIDDFPAGTIMGHEFVGTVLAIGSDVRGTRVGDRVLASDLIACGHCWWCERGWHYQCEHASLFGYGKVVGEDFAGGQAELVRIPRADLVLSRIEPSMTDAQAILIGDVLATAYTAVRESGLTVGDSLAVVGCGPVGLCTVMCGVMLGAQPVLAVDPHPERRRYAAELGAVALDEGAHAELLSLTGHRGADVVVEAVGSDSAFAAALELVRARGTVVIAGAHHSSSTAFPAQDAFARELSLKFVVGNPIAVREELSQLVGAGSLTPTAILSYPLPLTEAARGYELFDRQQAMKVTLAP